MICRYCLLLFVVLAVGCNNNASDIDDFSFLNGNWNAFSMGTPSQMLGTIKIDSVANTFVMNIGEELTTGLVSFGLPDRSMIDQMPELGDGKAGTISFVSEDFSITGYWSKVEKDRVIIHGLSDPEQVPGHPFRHFGGWSDISLRRDAP